jgi:hypothetical protein
VYEAFWGVFGVHRRAIRALMDAIGLSEIAAGVEPANGREKAATLAGGLAHDVSPLFGVGRHFGSQPREGLNDDHARATARAWPGQHTQRVRDCAMRPKAKRHDNVRPPQEL